MGVDSKSVVLLSIEYVSNYVNNEVSSEGRWKMKKTNLIKTPKERITLGECVRTETGEPALKVKKIYLQKTDVLKYTIPLSYPYIQMANSSNLPMEDFQQ